LREIERKSIESEKLYYIALAWNLDGLVKISQMNEGFQGSLGWGTILPQASRYTSQCFIQLLSRKTLFCTAYDGFSPSGRLDPQNIHHLEVL